MRFIPLTLLILLFSSCSSNPVDIISYAPPEDATYQHEEVEIKLKNGDILGGSLTFEKSLNKCNPIAVLITGSSPHDRDNSLATRPVSAYRPFRQISHALSSNGIAVLRVDDRGIGKSQGGHISKLTTRERAGDIEQCLSYLKTRPEFDSSRICLLGLSEGASIAHLIASRDKSIKCIVLLSGIGSVGSKILEYQVKNGLYSERDLAKSLRRDRNMQFLFDFDPMETIRLTQQPVLIVHGKTDRRVPYTDAYILAEELRNSGNGNVTVHVLPDHNHLLLKEVPSGKPSSYGQISSNALSDEVINLILNWIGGLLSLSNCNQPDSSSHKEVPQQIMEDIYDEVKTPFKYGVVLKHPDTTKMVDSPIIYRDHNRWFMTYIVFDGQGYETWLAESENLLHWKSKGKLLSYTDNTWDSNQKAGYLSLVNIDWGGDYSVEQYQDKYWMTYLGGNTVGYEAGILKIGLANSKTITESHEWDRISKPLLSPEDADARWFENKTIYKSLVIHDYKRHTGKPFVMYYNAKGDNADYESIGMAVSDDMVSWKRYGNNPVITKHKGICGDAQIAKYNDLYIMFYFGAFWKPGAFERFACSYDLIHWTDWDGADLIAPSEDYDRTYAHKPWVIKWNGIVYHFYNAVGNSGRVIALATSKDLLK